MVFGTFDILHPGHINFLRQAKKHGQLIAVIARDRTVKRLKGKKPIHNENLRLKLVERSGLADKVILGSKTDKYAAIKKYRPNIIALGYDQTHFLDQLGNQIKKIKLNAKIIRLKPFRPNQYKTSLISNFKSPPERHKIVAAVFRQVGKILMLDRKNFPFGWACPAGHVEAGETIELALLREIKEETNLNLKTYKLLIHEFVAKNKCVKGHQGHDWYVFEIGEWQGKIKIDEEEAKQLVWQSLGKIKTLKLEAIWQYWFEKLKII